MSCASIERDVDAFVDGELDGAADAAVPAHMQTCPHCLGLVRQRQALTRRIQAAPYYEAPAALRARVARQASQSAALRHALAIAAAAVLVLTGGAALVQEGAGSGRAQATRLVDAHIRALSADRLFEVRSTDQHTVKPWFAGKLDYSPPVTDLAAVGFPLTGGRVERVDGRAVATLVYQRRLHVIDVFVAPAATAWWPPASAYSVRGFQVRRWAAAGMSFWAVSDLNDAELAEFAHALGG